MSIFPFRFPLCVKSHHSASLCITLLLLWSAPIGAAPPAADANETAWTAYLAAQIPDARAEVRLADETRVDILTPTAAVEADWSAKWAEGVGQAAFYGAMTGRRGVVLILVRDPRAEKLNILRAVIAAQAAGCAVWAYDVTAGGWLALGSRPRAKS